MHTTTLVIIATCLILNGFGVTAIDYDRRTMLCLVNKERVQRGLSTLGPNQALDNAAQIHSNDQARMNTMTHTGSDGSDPGKRATEAGYDWRSVAENVAYGYPDEQTCMSKWMASPGHRANILKPGLTHFGSAMAVSGSTPYYTQDFGGDGKTYNFASCPAAYIYGGSSAPAPTPAPTPAPQPAPVPVPAPAYGPISAPGPSTDQPGAWTCIRSDNNGCFRWKKCTTEGNRWSCTEKWGRQANYTSSPAPAPAVYAAPEPAPTSTTPCTGSTPAQATASASGGPTDWTCIKSDSEGCFRWKKCTVNGNKWSCTEKWERHP